MRPSSPLLDAAEARWAQIELERPATAPALPLHRALLTRQVLALEELPPEAYVPGEGDGERAGAALRRGRPAFADTPEPSGLVACAADLTRYAGDLDSGGAGPAAAKVAAAAASGQLDVAAALRTCWHRQPGDLERLARRAGLNLQVAWLMLELVTAPLAHCRQNALLHGSEERRETVATWDRGHCPACGAWPVMAEYFLGDRLSRCAYCACAWPLSSLRCTYCGEQGAPFRTIAIDRARPGRRLELCRTCGGYLKTIDVGRPIPFPLLAIEDFASQDLDGAAQHHGFRRTPLRTSDS